MNLPMDNEEDFLFTLNENDRLFYFTWKKDKTRNPENNKKIKYNGYIYKRCERRLNEIVRNLKHKYNKNKQKNIFK